MKKSKLYLIIIFDFIFVLFTITFASTNTEIRTKDDLKIRSNINVTSSVEKAALNTPKVNASEKVYDFAELLTTSEEELLYNDIMDFINEYNMDMVVVTINYNNKFSYMDYADDFYDYNDFGIGSTYDGLLFLIDMDNRKMWISTTGEAILVYDDARIDKILDSTYDEIVKEDYYSCCSAFVKEASSYAELGIPNSNENYTINEYGEYVTTGEVGLEISWVHIIILTTIMTIIFVVITCSKHKTIKKATLADKYFKKSSLVFDVKEDKFITSHTSKVYIPPSSSSSSGGSGGGSSVHRSSSGRSHGGGGRSF